jgi:hypothetical protein
LWALKLEQDERVSAKLQKKLVKLCSDLRRLSEVPFPHKSIGVQGATKVVAFCDASKQAYGCAIHNMQEESGSLLFSKVKVALLMTKTLNTLELLSVFLAVNCLKNIVTTIKLSMCV